MRISLRYQHDIERKMAKRSFLSYIMGSYYELKPLAICILKIGTPAFMDRILYATGARNKLNFRTNIILRGKFCK